MLLILSSHGRGFLCWDRVPSLLFLKSHWCHYWCLTLWPHQVLITSLRPQFQALLSCEFEGYVSHTRAVGEHVQITTHFKILPWTQAIQPKPSFGRGSRHTQREHSVPAPITSDGEKQSSKQGLENSLGGGWEAPCSITRKRSHTSLGSVEHRVEEGSWVTARPSEFQSSTAFSFPICQMASPSAPYLHHGLLGLLWG